MDFIITFFRDVLDGPLYTGVAIVCGILICSCIGYLGEQYLNKQKARKEFEATHATLTTESGTDSVAVASATTPSDVQAPVTSQQVDNVNDQGQ